MSHTKEAFCQLSLFDADPAEALATALAEALDAADAAEHRLGASYNVSVEAVEKAKAAYRAACRALFAAVDDADGGDGCTIWIGGHVSPDYRDVR